MTAYTFCCCADISIHSLRVEGDLDSDDEKGADHDFNPLPPCGGRPMTAGLRQQRPLDFNPLPPCGGRLHGGSGKE